MCGGSVDEIGSDGARRLKFGGGSEMDGWR